MRDKLSLIQRSNIMLAQMEINNHVICPDTSCACWAGGGTEFGLTHMD